MRGPWQYRLCVRRNAGWGPVPRLPDSRLSSAINEAIRNVAGAVSPNRTPAVEGM